MAVQVRLGSRTASAIATRRPATSGERDYYIQYVIDGKTQRARKLDPVDFSSSHVATLQTAHFTEDRRLFFDNPAWQSVWLGAGEEKTVFLVIDEAERAFALELLVRGGYLNGRLTEGYYLADMRFSQVNGLKRDPNALLSLVYSGEAKIREFIHGETLLSALAKNARPQANWFERLLHGVSMRWATYVIEPRYSEIRRTFKDAHEANVMLELIPLHNPERKSHYMFPVPALAEDGRLHWCFYRLTPIDVRALPR